MTMLQERQKRAAEVKFNKLTNSMSRRCLRSHRMRGRQHPSPSCNMPTLYVQQFNRQVFQSGLSVTSSWLGLYIQPQPLHHLQCLELYSHVRKEMPMCSNSYQSSLTSLPQIQTPYMHGLKPWKTFGAAFSPCYQPEPDHLEELKISIILPPTRSRKVYTCSVHLCSHTLGCYYIKHTNVRRKKTVKEDIIVILIWLCFELSICFVYLLTTAWQTLIIFPLQVPQYELFFYNGCFW